MKYLSYFENRGKVHIKIRDDDGKDSWISETRPAPYFRITEEKTEYRSIYGNFLEKFEFDTISAAKKFIYDFPETKENLYGTSRIPFGIVSEMDFEEAFAEDYNVCILDIETEVERSRGVPNPLKADESINMISLKLMGHDQITAFTTCEVDIDEVCERAGISKDNLTLQIFETEEDMLWAYIRYFNKNNVDIYGGWNSEEFDMIYLGRRIEILLGNEALLEMSPFKTVERREFENSFGNEMIEFKVRGMYHIDFMKLYKVRVSKFEPRERHSLDYIANEELGVGKLEHESGIAGHLLYKHGHASAGLAYNIVDVLRVDQIVTSRRILDLNISLAQMCRLNLDDIEFVTRIVIGYTYNYLKKNNEFMPLATEDKRPRKYEGGYVYPTIKGRHKYMFTADIAASYPSSMRALNISPETKTRKLQSTPEEMMDGKSPEFDREIETMAPNGQCFAKGTRGMFPRVLDELAGHRQKYKDERNRLASLYGREKDPTRKADLKKQTEVYKSSDKAVKEVNNSVRGDTVLSLEMRDQTIEDFWNSISEDDIVENKDGQQVKSVSKTNAFSLNLKGQLECKPVNYVMKHRVRKKMYRIKCGGNFVDVTEDHSVVVWDTWVDELRSIKPVDLDSSRHKVYSL